MANLTDFSTDYLQLNSAIHWMFPTEAEDTYEFPRPSSKLCLFASVCSMIFAVVGSLGNLTTLIAFFKCRRLRNATTAFVVGLAVADLLFCAINLPLTAVRYLKKKWTPGDGLCTVFPFLFYGNVAASLFFMTAIALNRFVLINHYHLYNKLFSRSNVTVIIALCWACSFLTLTPTLLGAWGRFGYKEESFSCTIIPSKDGTSPKKFFFIIGFLFPVVTNIISYSSIYYKVRESEKKLKNHEPTLHPRSLHRILGKWKKDMQLTQTMFVSFCCFLICFLPLLVVNVFEKKIRYPEVHVVASVFAWMSSCIKPFVYVVLSHLYRQAYRRLFCPNHSNFSYSRSSPLSSRETILGSRLSVFPSGDVNIKMAEQSSSC